MILTRASPRRLPRRSASTEPPGKRERPPGSRTPSPPASEAAVPAFKAAFKYYKSRRPPPSLEGVLEMGSGDSRLTPMSLGAVPEQPELGLLDSRKWAAFRVPSHPGMYLARGAFSREGQLAWLSRAIRDFPVAPNVTNLDKFQPEEERGLGFGDDLGRLLRLRWTTLGFHYDWDAKVYREEARAPLSPLLARLAAAVAGAFGFPAFKAEAVILNYYPPKSTLSGHVDASEWSLEPPLLSLSFGQSAVYLQGGLSLDEEPLPLFLRSGDILIMAGAQRRVFHGVPRLVQDAAFPTSDKSLADYAGRCRVNYTIRQMQ